MNYQEELSNINDVPELAELACVLLDEWGVAHRECLIEYERYGTAPHDTTECWKACRCCATELRMLIEHRDTSRRAKPTCQSIRDAMVKMHDLMATMKPLIRQLEEHCDEKVRKTAEEARARLRARDAPPTPTPICDWHARNRHDSSGFDRWFGYDHDGD